MVHEMYTCGASPGDKPILGITELAQSLIGAIQSCEKWLTIEDATTSKSVLLEGSSRTGQDRLQS